MMKMVGGNDRDESSVVYVPVTDNINMNLLTEKREDFY